MGDLCGLCYLGGIGSERVVSQPLMRLTPAILLLKEVRYEASYTEHYSSWRAYLFHRV